MLDLNQPPHGVILGIDPGTINMGYCAMTVDLRTLERVKTETFTINADKPADGVGMREFIPDHHSDLFMRVREHGERLWDILVHYQPFQVAVELPFFNALSPTAFNPLIQMFAMIQNTVYDYNAWMTLYKVENTVTKAMVAPDSKEERKRIREAYATSKERIAACVKMHKDFQFIDTETKDEHEIDASLVSEWRRRQLLIGFIDQP